MWEQYDTLFIKQRERGISYISLSDMLFLSFILGSFHDPTPTSCYMALNGKMLNQLGRK